MVQFIGCFVLEVPLHWCALWAKNLSQHIVQLTAIIIGNIFAQRSAEVKNAITMKNCNNIGPFQHLIVGYKQISDTPLHSMRRAWDLRRKLSLSVFIVSDKYQRRWDNSKWRIGIRRNLVSGISSPRLRDPLPVSFPSCNKAASNPGFGKIARRKIRSVKGKIGRTS